MEGRGQLFAGARRMKMNNKSKYRARECVEWRALANNDNNNNRGVREEEEEGVF